MTRIRQGPRYTGIATFMGTPLAEDLSGIDIALVGVPFDGGSENRPGPRHAPREIRNMSSLVRAVHPVTRINPFRLCTITDVGDVPFSNPFDIDTAHRDITVFMRRIHEAGVIPLSAGGDHSISLPILRAIAADGPVGLLQIDAHTDTCDEEFGCRITHGTPFRRAVEEGLIDSRRTVQVGIRGAQESTEGWDYSRDSGMRVIFIEEFEELGIAGTVAEIGRCLGEGAVYLTYDIDSLDPAFAPGTGTPEIGGMTTREAQALIRGLADLHLVGADVVEVSPPFDPTGSTALVGATMMYEILCVLASSRFELEGA